ncbi:MAG: hypothetical protein ABWW70_01425 [Thermoproteota archaeon]
MSVRATALLVILVLGTAAVLWFFHIRRRIVKRMRYIVGALEAALRPADTEYTVLGYLVGFKAVYKVRRRGVDRAWILYTIPPYHVLFYLPVIAALREAERLELTFRLERGVRGEAHIYDPRDRAVRRLVKKDVGDRAARMAQGLVDVGARRYEALYTSSDALEDARRIAQELQRLGVDVRRSSVVGTLSAIHVSLVPGAARVEEVVRRLVRLAEAIASR